jgi:hypothetical protein
MVTDYKYTKVALADADWAGPLYVCTEDKRGNTGTFVARHAYVLNIDVPGCKDDDILYLTDGGGFALTGTRPVGSVIGCDHPDKGPIAFLDPAACAIPQRDGKVVWDELDEVWEVLSSLQAFLAAGFPEMSEDAIEVIDLDIEEEEEEEEEEAVEWSADAKVEE